MYTYVNKFNFATNMTCTEVMISFQQAVPIFSEDSTLASSSSTPIADIVMTPQLAHELAEKLLTMFDNATPQTQE